MNRTHAMVAGWCCALAACAGQAQTTLPQFFIWIADQSCPEEPSGWTHDSRFQTATYLKVGSAVENDCTMLADPENAGKAAALRLRQRAFPSNDSTIDAEWSTLVVINFASCNVNTETCLYRNSDQLSEPTDWGGSAPTTAEKIAILRRHPWLTDAREELLEWTEDFIAEFLRLRAAPTESITISGSGLCPCEPGPLALSSGQIIPFPRYILVDSEPPDLAPTSMHKIAAIASLETDDRWDDDAHPVPGFDGKTLKEVWEDTAADYGMNPADTPSDYIFFEWGSPGVGVGTPYQHPNRRLFMRFTDVMLRVHAAVLEECFYEPIRAAIADWNTAHSTDQIVAPLFSQYNASQADGEPDRFGWFEDNAGTDNAATARVPAYEFPRVFINWTNEASRSCPAQYSGNSLTSPTGPVNFPGVRWLTSRTHTFSEFDAPNFYPVELDATPFNHVQKNLYLINHPTEQKFEPVMRVRRQNIESAINSGSGGRQHSMMPWVAAPYYEFDDYAYTEEELLHVLSLCRHKDVEKIAVWMAGGETLDKYESVRTTYLKAYMPRLVSREEAFGSGIVGPVEHLWTTLRDPENADEEQTVRVEADFFEEAPTTVLECHFEGLLDAPGCGLRINLECWVDSTTPDVTGQIWLWKHHGTGMGEYHQVHIDDDVTNWGHDYVFAIGETGGDHGYLRYLRRSFDILNATEFVSDGGEVSVQLWHHNTDFFTYPSLHSYYDLVQIVRVNGNDFCAYDDTEENSMAWGGGGDRDLAAGPARVGPDTNRNGVVDAADADLFAEIWMRSRLLADYDNDGVVSGDDLVLFAGDFEAAEP